MGEIRNNAFCNPGVKETVCIDTYRILDSCRDKDCFENVKVYMTDYGQEIIERTSNIRAKEARVLWAYIDVDTVPFNRGFYQLNVRIYIKIICEACLCPGNVQELEGIAVVEKKVILFGSEGSVSIFKSEAGCTGFCSPIGKGAKASSNLPIAVLETVDPIILSASIAEPHSCQCRCCCAVEDIPENVCCCVSGSLCDGEARGQNSLYVTLGLFSVIRIERPTQLLVNAVEYCVPEKECVMAEEDDPCKLFRSMAFPINEFCPPSIGSIGNGNSCDYERDRSGKNCHCDKL